MSEVSEQIPWELSEQLRSTMLASQRLSDALLSPVQHGWAVALSRRGNCWLGTSSIGLWQSHVCIGATGSQSQIEVPILRVESLGRADFRRNTFREPELLLPIGDAAVFTSNIIEALTEYTGATLVGCGPLGCIAYQLAPIVSGVADLKGRRILVFRVEKKRTKDRVAHKAM